MGTGETTRRLIEAHPDAWVIGLDSSPDMVFRARESYDDVQLARIEDPLPDGPWDLVICVLSVHHLTNEQKRNLFRRVSGHVPRPGDRRRLRRRTSWPERSTELVRRRGHLAARVTWRSSRAVYCRP